ncbi:arylsulfatase [Tellurirhabdus rosea]|uniref:arylsulfatase n=1 Tax=Tellurirhabdus rosea TaxID=2674997 RepID=UPI002250E636|nr:arylsulfatase [Tellurirhabdus rosea]
MNCLLLLTLTVQAQQKPNVIFILADDLGYGDLGCYQQQFAKTPHLDGLARDGMRFTQAYAGAPVCAPSRSALMTGKHTGHTYIRGNFGPDKKRVSFPDSVFTMAELFRAQGYATGLFGKWGLGAKGSAGTPNKQGFDDFAGYLDQAHAHDYYPDFLNLNETEVRLPENANGQKATFSADWTFNRLKSFVEANARKPFFVYFATTLPHDKYQMPVRPEYRDKPWPEGQKIYASMITHLDEQVGQLRQLLARLGLEDNTLLIFTSDNGPATLPAHGPESPAVNAAYFHSAGPLRGIKRDPYEGGIRVPMLVYWKNKIPKGSQQETPCAFWDFMPTFADLTGYRPKLATDGISLLPLLLGKPAPQSERPLYWEFHLEGDNEPRDVRQSLRLGRWKAIRHGLLQPTELYDLQADLSEKKNVAAQFPDVTQKLTQLLNTSRTDSPFWPLQPVNTGR